MSKTNTRKRKAKALTGVFAQQWQGSVDRDGQWKADLDRNGNRIPANSFTCTIVNGSKSDLAPVLTKSRIAKLQAAYPAFMLENKDYVLVRTREFDDRDGREPAIRGWFRPKAEAISI